MCDRLWSWQHGDLGLPFRKKYMKPFHSSTFHTALDSLSCSRLSMLKLQWEGAASDTCHYLHSSFRPEWRESPHCTRSGSCHLCWCSARCYRSGRSADTHLCLRLKLKRIKLIWRTWNYPFSLHFQTYKLGFRLFHNIHHHPGMRDHPCQRDMRQKRTLGHKSPLCLSIKTA